MPCITDALLTEPPLPFDLHVTEDVMRDTWLVTCRWPDGFVIHFEMAELLITTTNLPLVALFEGERRKAEMHPLALWSNWEWYE